MGACLQVVSALRHCFQNDSVGFLDEARFTKLLPLLVIQLSSASCPDGISLAEAEAQDCGRDGPEGEKISICSCGGPHLHGLCCQGQCPVADLQSAGAYSGSGDLTCAHRAARYALFPRGKRCSQIHASSDAFAKFARDLRALLRVQMSRSSRCKSTCR